jgi:hypothetical protein
MFEILVRPIQRVEQARRLNETTWIVLSKPRCTPAALDSHPRGLSDYSLVKEQWRVQVIRSLLVEVRGSLVR